MILKNFIYIFLVINAGYVIPQEDGMKIDESLLSEEAEWDSFAGELEGNLGKDSSASKIPSEEEDKSWEEEFKATDAENSATKTPVNEMAKGESKENSSMPQKETIEADANILSKDSNDQNASEADTFELGPEENELIQLSQVLSTQISDEEWRSITQSSSTMTYIVQKDDWLFKISKKLFGSGLYYPKIWSMNPHITNPHEIEPDTQLVFDPGSAIMPPQLSVGGTFESDQGNNLAGTSKWFDEKRKLLEKGVEVISSDDELSKVMGPKTKNEEYKKYTPPQMEIVSKPPEDQYDSFGIEKASQSQSDFKQGHYLNTFVTTNEMKNLGEFTDMVHEAISLNMKDRVYVTFEEGQSPQAGELFSVYTDLGEVKTKFSERSGRKFVICGSLKLLQQIDVEERKWEAIVTEFFVPAERGSKLTSYTPKIDKVFKNFNSRVIEGTIISGYRELNTYFTMGDVVYIDRGRSDGVEVGNVFDVYDTMDRGQSRQISTKPTYRTGELTIISVTDNFSTAVVSNATMDFKMGDLVRTRSSEEEKIAITNQKPKVSGVEVKDFQAKSVGDEIYSKVKDVNLTSQELAELERQRAQRDILDETERDLKELEELESTISKADNLLKYEFEDKVGSKDLEDVEGQIYQQGLKVNLDAVEEKYGKKYLDENLNSADNPFGLSQYDVEEVDELLNLQKADNDATKSDTVSNQSSAPSRSKTRKR